MIGSNGPVFLVEILGGKALCPLFSLIGLAAAVTPTTEFPNLCVVSAVRAWILPLAVKVLPLLGPVLETDLEVSEFGSAGRLAALRGTGSLDNRGIPDGLENVPEDLSIFCRRFEAVSGYFLFLFGSQSLNVALLSTGLSFLINPSTKTLSIKSHTLYR